MRTRRRENSEQGPKEEERRRKRNGNKKDVEKRETEKEKIKVKVEKLRKEKVQGKEDEKIEKTEKGKEEKGREGGRSEERGVRGGRGVGGERRKKEEVGKGRGGSKEERRGREGRERGGKKEVEEVEEEAENEKEIEKEAKSDNDKVECDNGDKDKCDDGDKIESTDDDKDECDDEDRDENGDGNKDINVTTVIRIPDDAAATIQIRQELLNDRTIEKEVMDIKPNLGYLPDAIIQLEKLGVELVEQINIMRSIVNKLSAVEGEIGKRVGEKVNRVLIKNDGYGILSRISDVLTKTCPNDIIQHVNLIDEVWFPTSNMDSEMNFSAYTKILTDSQISAQGKKETMLSNVSCSQEVKRRIAMAKEAFNRKGASSADFWKKN
ncbi:hypothetical protein ANN_01651 [Periplaneta americana]|uniref:Uncharacterized protein n=1 Tax=Periplaneta americana TaxID=6978 RepID=A0ABQ8TVX5_PERAM|nr:hypothetical protein ANN_01651 [Periplaneta americana]